MYEYEYKAEHRKGDRGVQNMNRGNVFGINGKIETECLTVVGAQYAPIGAMNMEDVDRNTETLLSFMDRASGL